jgi:tRNA 2-thiouridine synthesizing protein A
MESDYDLRGTRCPISTMRLKKHLRSLKAGTIVRVLADDDDARIDFPALIKKSGHGFVKFTEHGDYFSFDIAIVR